jgi:hypothetical protein
MKMKKENAKPFAITPDCAKMINEYLRCLDSYSEREMLLEIICDDICLHCGDVVKGVCHCMNDE